MHGGVIIGPGMPAGAEAEARVAFFGKAFRAHVHLAEILRLPAYVATPRGPVSLDTRLKAHQRWKPTQLAAAATDWAESCGHEPILALVDDSDVDIWERASTKITAPLRGLSPDQRASLARVLEATGELPSWAPNAASLLRCKASPEPSSPPARRSVVRLDLLQEEVEIGRLLYPEAATLQRPRTRGECEGGPRPCPWVGCRHNLYLEVTPAGSLLLRNQQQEVWDVDPGHSCALDVADQRGGLTGVELAEILGVSRQRAAQIERTAHERVQRRLGSIENVELDLAGDSEG